MCKTGCLALSPLLLTFNDVTGSKTTLQVHYTGNKTNWNISPGLHGLCGSRLNSTVAMVEQEYEAYKPQVY